jgi:hypothetical protein
VPVGSKQWIGANEVGYILENLLQVQYKIMFVTTGAELEQKGRCVLSLLGVKGLPHAHT